LSMLAAVDNVEAYRTIEAYLKNPEPGLREWAVLALLESRMLLESSLLEETQMFISTGLGGKGAKLRYFTVLLHKERKDFSGIQQRIVRSEFDFLFGKENCEIEEIEFNRHIVTLMALIPIEKSIRSLFGDCLAECNQYGNFIDRNYIVTNVKKLTIDQIERFLNSKDKNKALEELGNSPVR
ncbi:MAG: hypothetical protein KJ607_07425, partial [Bacteroidetes bacterium]|nr:hypothetical protein [Bacteroidota bacterium]